MTPDESAWVTFAAAGMSASPEVRFTSVAGDADEMLRLLRARRTAGEFDTQLVYENARGNPDTNAPAPSEIAKVERIRALEAGLRQIDQGLQDGHADPFVRGETTVRDIINDLLHSHQSWCRTEHEGACVPSERPEP